MGFAETTNAVFRDIRQAIPCRPLSCKRMRYCNRIAIYLLDSFFIPLSVRLCGTGSTLGCFITPLYGRRLPVNVPVYPSVCTSILCKFCRSDYPSVCSSTPVLVHLSLHVTIYTSMPLSIPSCVRLSLCVFVCPSLCPPIPFCACLFLRASVYPLCVRLSFVCPSIRSCVRLSLYVSV